jgi:poly(A) polymerase
LTKQLIKINKVDASSLGIDKKLISINALKVLQRLTKSGYQAFLVGGCIRDLLLGIRPKDFDVATNAEPEEIKHLFRNCRLIGRRFRLAHIRFGRELIEVATYRSSAQSDNERSKHDNKGRILRDNVYGRIEEDVFRRDFKCNALYYDNDKGKIWDFVDGLNDLQTGQLNFIGDAVVRLKEDPVRMLRAARFKAKLNFKIDSRLSNQIKLNAHLLSGIPAARIFDEFIKLFQSGYAEETFHSLLEFDLFKELFPETDKQLKVDNNLKYFIENALKNTDTRIKNKQSITPMFLLGVFLWGPISHKASKIKQKSKSSKAQSLILASYDVIGAHQDRISIPKRFSSIMREMFVAQAKFEITTDAQAKKMSNSRIFRAAYDFLLLRSEINDCPKEVIDFWTKVEQRTVKINPKFNKNKKYRFKR